MRRLRFTKCLIMLALVVVMVTALTLPAFAADFGFSYIDWEKTDTTFTVYTGASNLKTVNSQEATVKGTSVDYDSNTNGWGFRVVYKGSASNPVSITPSGYVDVTKRTFWINGNYTIHTQYRDGYGGKGTSHYVAARLDNDSADGQYTFEGKFNSDYT